MRGCQLASQCCLSLRFGLGSELGLLLRNERRQLTTHLLLQRLFVCHHRVDLLSPRLGCRCRALLLSAQCPQLSGAVGRLLLRDLDAVDGRCAIAYRDRPVGVTYVGRRCLGGCDIGERVVWRTRDIRRNCERSELMPTSCELALRGIDLALGAGRLDRELLRRRERAVRLFVEHLGLVVELGEPTRDLGGLGLLVGDGICAARTGRREDWHEGGRDHCHRPHNRRPAVWPASTATAANKRHSCHFNNKGLIRKWAVFVIRNPNSNGERK